MDRPAAAAAPAPVEIRWPRAAPGKARARAVYVPALGRARMYTPDTTVGAEDNLLFYAQQAMAGRPPLEGPLRLTVECFYRPPQSWSGKAKIRAMGAPKESKPDLDNIEKLVMDALNGVCWADDRQVTAKAGGKWWGPVDEVLITIEPAPVRRVAEAEPAPMGALL